MPGRLDFRVTQRFDIVNVGGAAFVAFPRRLPSLQLHGAQFVGDQGRACPLVVGALGQQMQQRTASLRATATAAI